MLEQECRFSVYLSIYPLVYGDDQISGLFSKKNHSIIAVKGRYNRKSARKQHENQNLHLYKIRASYWRMATPRLIQRSDDHIE